MDFDYCFLILSFWDCNGGFIGGFMIVMLGGLFLIGGIGGIVCLINVVEIGFFLFCIIMFGFLFGNLGGEGVVC